MPRPDRKALDIEDGTRFHLQIATLDKELDAVIGGAVQNDTTRGGDVHPIWDRVRVGVEIRPGARDRHAICGMGIGNTVPRLRGVDANECGTGVQS